VTADRIFAVRTPSATRSDYTIRVTDAETVEYTALYMYGVSYMCYLDRVFKPGRKRNNMP